MRCAAKRAGPTSKPAPNLPWRVRARARQKGIEFEGSQAGSIACRNARNVVVNSHAVAIEMVQVASDAAADVEYEPRMNSPQVPAIWALRIDDSPQPATALRQPLQTLGVGGLARGWWRGVGHRNSLRDPAHG